MTFQSAALLCAAAIWYTRFRYDLPGAERDFKWVLGLWYTLTPWMKPRWILKACVFDFCSWYWIYLSYKQRKVDSSELKLKLKLSEMELQHGLYRSQIDYNDAWSPMKPVLFPCRTSHTRLFPRKHSFSYSYLFVGIPVGWRGYVSTILSADLKTLPWGNRQPENGWFNVDSADHLARGEKLHGLQGKLDAYLESQDEKLEDYPHAYLVTAPRFLGYSFNPVSFWYLYNRRGKLKAIILEVNNTFDERRMYFLKNEDPNDSIAGEQDLRNTEDPPMTAEEDKERSPSGDKVAGKFAAAWKKDFHVSPFNSRKGSYSLSARDPFVNHLINGNLMASCGRVNNTITLSSSKDHPKLIARVFSTSDSVDPYSLSEWQVLKFVLSWWWVGFVTFPRIVREAGKLFFRRKLHVWFRPEVMKDSLGRNETNDEKAIAILFRDYLKSLVEGSTLPIPLHFTSNIATMPASETFTPRSLSHTQPPNPNPPPPLILKPTTPLFYAHLARQPSLHHYLNSSLANPDPQTSIFHTSNPHLLLQLFADSQTPSNQPMTRSLSLLHRLRSQPSRTQSYISPLDVFAMRLYTADARKVCAYRKAALKLLVSDYVAFGMPGAIDAVAWGVRICLCWVCVRSLEGLVGLGEEGGGNMHVGLAKMTLGCVGVHLWAGAGLLS